MDAGTIALVQTLVNGALLGCLFGCIALGLTIKWGLLGVADFSHISLTVIAAYLTYTVAADVGLSPFAALLLTVPAFFLVGVLLQLGLVRIRAAVFTTLLITFGLFIAAESLVSLVWSSDLLNLRPTLPDALRQPLRLPEPLDRVAFQPVDLLSLVAALVMVGGSAYLLRKTRHGRALHAMHQDAAVAEVFGVRLVPLAVVVSGLAAASAAVSGTLVALKLSLTPTLSASWLGIVVVSCLLGGLGRPVGALLAAVLLMMVQNAWSLYLSPTWAPAIAYGVLFAYLGAAPLFRAVSTRMAATRPAAPRLAAPAATRS
ncbi:branched-chain amino acid ABC transporter permease [Modestobacter versicolor]|uniref:branched-chain amino acid ABC transporter permease n=1 Tax=Modestobacter versicolor TaxID=429133 RepID=UPI0034DF99BC